MKKTILPLALVALMFSSCGGGDKTEKINEQAKELCACVAEKAAADAQQESEFSIDMTSLNFATCAFNVALSGVDAADDAFGAAIAENCPDLNAAWKEYKSSAQ